MSLMNLKIGKKLLSIFGIEAQGCLNFDHFRFKYKGKRAKLSKISDLRQKITKNFRFEARELLTKLLRFSKI